MNCPQSANQNYGIDASYLDQEFGRYVVAAQGLMREMKSSDDRRICARYITVCSKMKSENQTIKFHRNRFFRFLLKVMQRTLEHQKIEKDYFFNLPDEMLKPSEKNDMQQWSSDGRTYVAAKIIPGYATLVYMAVTDNSEDNWDHNGFAKFSSYLPNIDVERVLHNAEMAAAE